MKFILIIITLLTFGLLASAQTTGQFQSVGGDFGKSWINNFMSQNQKPAEDLKNDLWNWGGTPRGKTLVGGKLVDAANTTTSAVNFTANWLGDISGSKPIYFNSSSPYGNYGLNPNDPTKVNAAPLTPMALSDDPWILAQQLERPVITQNGYYTPF